MARQMKKPEKGDKPKKITTKNPPGGPGTPGAKAARRREPGARQTSDTDVKAAARNAARKREPGARQLSTVDIARATSLENKNGTKRSR